MVKVFSLRELVRVDANAPVRVLAEPMHLQESGLSLWVTKLTSDSIQTVLEYRLSGLPLQPQEGASLCPQPPTLRLPDGSLLLPLVLPPDYDLPGSFRLTFPALPPEAEKVTFFAPCGFSPVILPLRLIPEEMIIPATELPLTFQAESPLGLLATAAAELVNPPAYPTDFPDTPTPVPQGSSLYLDRALELEDSYLIVGNFTNAGDLPGDFFSGEVQIPYEFVVTDASGARLPFSFRPDLMPSSPWDGVTFWAIEIYKPVQPPVTIALPAIELYGDDTFTFFIACNPCAGMKSSVAFLARLFSPPKLWSVFMKSPRGLLFRKRSLFMAQRLPES